MRLALSLVAIAGLCGPPAVASAAMTPRGVPVPIACQGPDATMGRKVAKENGLKIGSDPAACFGRMHIYDGNSNQIIAVAPSRACPKGSALEVYDQSRAGSWYSFFEKPVCGSTMPRR